MSLIMVAGNKDFILFSGEQRCIDQHGNIIQEDYKKVHKINKNILIAFAGDKQYCEIITKYIFDNTFTSTQKLCLEYDDVERLIESQFKSVVEQVEESNGMYRKAKAYIILGGVSNEKLKLSAFFYEENFTIEKFILNEENPKLIVLGSGKYDHNGYCLNLFSNKPYSIIKNFKEIFNKTIENGLKYDITINKNLIFEEIKK
ncbi:hypothetical protein [Clostridium perfringens]|uniref:hypothetical protein n=1 Tax=Clostridium perfringens TaxID=1502 RepID=UPI0008A6CCCC|nr:hypothetical protein [Clostridium perfringens]DAJ44203.1 MAG TPA: Proteasome subunit alpha type-2 [Caudoviricetes sp.]AOY53360.1 hypothetical protein FORC25_0942 [Clostridium perfringens]MDK0679997.1 hypothetical protein [Clostridium perfringens]MDK0856465.1 hypothetical protein [Clostridium perfringens]UUW66917.1 hypothetical protein NQ197_04865 [Clostridium perfringens]